MRAKEESEKSGLKLNMKKIKIMASGSITPWQIEGGKVDVVTDFIFLGSKITEEYDRSHEIKRYLFLGRKAMTNIDRVLKIRDITLPTKIRIVKAMVFPVVIYRCESWTIKKSEGQNLCFQIVVLEKTPESPLDYKETNQYILKEINP